PCAIKIYHELAAARAPLARPERRAVPPASLRSGGTNMSTSASLTVGEVSQFFLPPQGEVRRSRDGGWFPPTMTSATGSARAARLSHELAAARAPLARPERRAVPPNSLRSRGDKHEGWFPPAMTSSTGSARVARLSHELAAARAPPARPDRRAGP